MIRISKKFAPTFFLSHASARVADQVRSLQWLERQIAAETAATEKECRDFYEAHLALFTQPVRFRASHIFLAASADTPPENVESKREMINALAGRLARRETLPQLAEEASEDEATKARGGDLGFFSSERMPPNFRRGRKTGGGPEEQSVPVASGFPYRGRGRDQAGSRAQFR